MRFLWSLGFGIWSFFACSALAAAPVKIRLATLAPKDTSLHKTLQQMGESWRKTTGDRVQLTIYTDGTMGGEADMVRRMRVGQIQAAMLSVPGLSQVEESVRALQLMPMMFRSLDEFEFVFEKLRPGLEKKFRDRGFEVLFWGDLGWVRFFSKQPGRRIDDYRKMKVFVWSGDQRSAEVMKAVRVNAVAAEQTDVLPGLQTGLFDMVPSVPIYALAGQFYGPAPHMLELNWVPLVGATIVSKKSWDATPADKRAALMQAAAEAGKQVRTQGRRESDEAVVAMQKRGLKVTKPTPEDIADWVRFMDEAYPKIRGNMVPADIFDEVVKLVKEYRAKAK
ncbi:MAG: TRAP dicarboxylate transporter-DctP subunit [Limisphaerales bacterium]|nr:MAG: TRAP dicarboxylate transporter-DctP subunit [Limisphaerales bacterium]KAG0509130.1 MAG: TRAP dicarboxylate transporter-DctP subunit [Limisphaerales bacterium]TXT50837.1 MAG: TRAP dicarboxylate transporter-DctP subunit [Limisphaerales bacterium]